MLRRVANKVTIHGVKDAWHANSTGRAFFLTVFLFCLTVMVFQLKGLFHGYITEAVGTRVTSTAESDAARAPSVYYCSEHWLPKAEGIRHYKQVVDADPSLNRSYSEIYEECVHAAVYNKSSDQLLFTDSIMEKDRLNDLLKYLAFAPEPKKHCWPFLQHWKSIVKQELVNSIVQPMRVFSDIDLHGNTRAHYWSRPVISMITRKFAAGILADPIQSLLNSEASQSLQTFAENSVRNLTLYSEENTSGCETCKVRYESSSTVMTEVLDVNIDKAVHNYDYYVLNFQRPGKIRKTDPFAETYDVLSNHILHPSAVSTSFDGVCMEYPIGPQYPATKADIGQKHRHVVINLGGFTHQLREIVRQTSSVEKAYYAFFYYARILDKHYDTYIALSEPKQPGLYFKQKLRVDEDNSFVSVKYWKKSSAHLNRKAGPCRSGSWTELDQAHCNQELSRLLTVRPPCETYLPASKRYPETPVTNNTCVYDYTHIFKEILSALGEVTFANRTFTQSPAIKRQLSSLVTSRVRYDTLRDVISRLTVSNRECPKPCSHSVFSLQTSYPSPTKVDARLCHMAQGYWLTPKTHESNDYSPKYWFRTLYGYLALSGVRGTPGCSVIEYERMDVHEQITEEYLLYGLSDIAANLGGSVGLWTGASVMSLVQCAYLCCLKKLFKRVGRKITYRRTKELIRCVKDRFGKARLTITARCAAVTHFRTRQTNTACSSTNQVPIV